MGKADGTRLDRLRLGMIPPGMTTATEPADLQWSRVVSVSCRDLPAGASALLADSWPCQYALPDRLTDFLARHLRDAVATTVLGRPYPIQFGMAFGMGGTPSPRVLIGALRAKRVTPPVVRSTASHAAEHPFVVGTSSELVKRLNKTTRSAQSSRLIMHREDPQVIRGAGPGLLAQLRGVPVSEIIP